MFLVLLFAGAFTGVNAGTWVSAGEHVALLSQSADLIVDLLSVDDDKQASSFAETDSSDDAHPVHGYIFDLFPSISGGPQAYKAKTQYAQYSDTAIRGPPAH
ncbi:MAG: hypothetical protein VW258_04665 [Thalassolituus sp.]